jgi:DNA-binding MarR family transcriptional regulator
MEEDKDVFVPARLSILVYLYFTQNAKFTSLQKKLNLTSGNLSSHLKKLQSMSLVRISKRFVELKPTTLVVITQEGVERVRSQLLRMREIVSVLLEKDTISQPSSTQESTQPIS